jgi:hypothetical protein
MIQYLPKLALLGLIFLGLIPGFSGLFLIEAVIAVIMLGGASSIANSKGLVSGYTVGLSQSSFTRKCPD